VDSTLLLWATLYGWAVWGELPPPTLWLGAPMVVMAGLVIAWREHRLARAASANVPAKEASNRPSSAERPRSQAA